MLSGTLDRKNLTVLFVPDYIEIALSAKGIALEQLGRIVTDDIFFKLFEDMPEGDKQLAKQLMSALSKQDIKDLLSANVAGFSLLSNSREYKMDRVIGPLQAAYSKLIHFFEKGNDDFQASNPETKRYNLTTQDVLDYIKDLSAQTTKTYNINMNNNITDDGLLETRVGDSIVYVILHRGFFSFTGLKFNLLADYTISRLLFTLFSYYGTETVFNSPLFSSLFTRLR